MAKVDVQPVSQESASHKVVDLTKASPDDFANDPLLARLKEWDKDGDGVFSPKEVLAAAREVSEQESKRKQAEKTTKLVTTVAFALGFLLLMSIGCNFASTLYAISISKEDDIPDTSGVMLTRKASTDSPPPQPVSTAAIKLETSGISGLKEATKEELDKLEEVTFFHDGGYHILKVAQVHRYDGRVEVWGFPFGILVVEDTGEVHYSQYSLPSETMDDCWGENSTVEDEDVCGASVDNEPPDNLEVEDPKEFDPENAPAPPGGRRLVGISADGEAVYDEGDEEARRLSSRRRSGGSSRRRASSSSSRRRSGGSSSSRRRSPGGYTSSGSHSTPTDARRRAAPPTRRRTSPTPPAPSGRRRVPARTDGSSRRRSPNYYNTPEDSRRRSISSSTVAAGAAGLAVGGAAGFVAGGGLSNPTPSTVIVAPGPSPFVVPAGSGGSTYVAGTSTVTSVCPANQHQECSSGSCWCTPNSAGGSAWIAMFVIGGCCFCCCIIAIGVMGSK